jgi:hypothetical protein
VTARAPGDTQDDDDAPPASLPVPVSTWLDTDVGTQSETPGSLQQTLARLREEETEPRVTLPGGATPWQLDVVGGREAGQLVPVANGRVVVGRQLGALRFDDPFVGDGHASFFLRGDALVVEDGGTLSGVFVSVGPRVIVEPGHVFACGLQVFRFLGGLDAPTSPESYGAPVTSGLWRVEHLLVGERSGRVVLFRHGLHIGRTQGAFRFEDDALLDDLHVELKPGPSGMELITHSQRWPTFVRIPAGSELRLDAGDLVRVGTATLRVLGAPR